jgi:hypothetical protein
METTMITWIGLCAGEVWRYLDKHEGQAPMKSLLTGIDAPKETIFMAIGWLAREGYVIMEGNMPNLTLKLNAKPPAKS